VRRFLDRDQGDTRPLARAMLKDLVFPSVPARPLAVFLYMYVLRLGLFDGRAGLRFCFFHAWYQATVSGLAAEATRATGPGRRGMVRGGVEHETVRSYWFGRHSADGS
jgi:hypothetical protein